MAEKRRTTTSNFGVSKRESHDASGFYQRFTPPSLSSDDTVLAPVEVQHPFMCGDARSMSTIADGSVALVVTSPPYFAGKTYEEELQREGIPASYLEYLSMLRDVFAECVRTLEPGGRIAVNVANLGRKPYRSLSADVIRILQDDLGLLLRGEVIWQKGEGASGSCAWGSFRSASNPVLRDISERVVIASKGRFDRARSVKQREAEGLPHQNTIPTDEFMALTLDVWHLPTESAQRVGHPAPFPVDLPEQLIGLYTYAGDLVLDPFMGSGSTLVAAARLGRRYAGYDLDPDYVELAKRRVREPRPPVDQHGMAIASGRSAIDLAHAVLIDAGFTITTRGHRIPKSSVAVSFSASDKLGRPWFFDVAGPLTAHRDGMTRNEVVWRSLGRAHAVRGRSPDTPFVLLTSALPSRSSEGDTALRAAGPRAFYDAVSLVNTDDIDRLTAYAAGSAAGPLLGFWTQRDLDSRR